MAKLSDEELLAAIDAAEVASYGPQSSEIASDRADAMDRYTGKPYGDELPGRSQVVSRDISDVVEGVVANVLKPFVGGDRVATFNPRGPEDEEGAEQETDYVNFVLTERNNGFVVLNSAVKDALLLRNGYLKCGWTVRQDVMIETYEGLSDEELALLMQDEDVQIIEQSEYPDPFAQGAAMMMGQMQPQAVMPGMPPQPGPQVPPQMPMLYDVKVRRKKPTEYVEVMPAPPDELLVSKRATEPSVQKADFVQHRTHKTLSELREMGYNVSDDIIDTEDSSETIEDLARAQFASDVDIWTDATSVAARKLVLYKETYMKVDYDGDGIAELRRICTVGKTILTYKGGGRYKAGQAANEEADLIPIACFTPVLMPHRHLGISVYDLIKDVAQIKTAMLRSMLDNRYLQNNAEKVINVDAVENIDDFLISRPGGVKRVKGSPADAVMPLVVPDTGSGAMMALQYLDEIRENRTGYTKTAEGMKSGSLATDTLGELNQQLSQSSMRLEMIARTIAETGVRDLFQIIHALTLKHSTREEKVRLRNTWVDVNPREWVRRTDMSISVGLGSTSGPQQLQHLTMIAQAQQQAAPLGLVTPENAYNLAAKLVSATGMKNPEEFFTKPPKQPKLDQNGKPVMGPDGQPVMESAPPPQHPDPMVEVEKIKGQTQMQIAQMKGQLDAQMAQVKAQADAQIEAARAQADVEVQRIKIQTQAQLEMERTRQQLMLEDVKHSREQQTQLQIAQGQQQNALEIARINAESKVVAADITATKNAQAAAVSGQALDRDVNN